jgi:hypothetical protein
MITFLFILLYKLYHKDTGISETIYLAFAFGFALIVFSSFGIEKLWSKYLKLRILKLFLFPGAVVHELSHTLLCLITGTTIKELNIFKLEGDGIKYDKPKAPVIFDFFITTAPIFGCAFILILISIILGNPIRIDESLPYEVTFSIKAVFDYSKNFLDIIWLTLNEFWGHGFHTISSIIFIIASIIFTVSMAPHKSDIKYIVLGFIILGISLYVLEWFDISLLGYKWWVEMLDSSWRITSYIISILLTILFISSILIGVIKVIKLTIGHKG